MSTSTPDVIPGLARAGQRESLFTRVMQAAKARLDAYAEDRALCRTMRILRELDDRTLQDIGLHRSEIGSLVYGRRGERGWTR